MDDGYVCFEAIINEYYHRMSAFHLSWNKQTHTHTHGDAFPRKNHRSSHIDWRKVQWTVINGMNVFGVTILHRLFNESNSNERLHRCHNTMKFLIPYDFPNIAMAYELIHKWMYASQTTRTATTKFIKATFVWAC